MDHFSNGRPGNVYYLDEDREIRSALYRDGMRVGAFLRAGGRRVDLAWDIEKGWIYVKASPSQLDQ